MLISFFYHPMWSRQADRVSSLLVSGRICHHAVAVEWTERSVRGRRDILVRLYVKTISFAPLNETDVVIDKDFGLGHNPPLDFLQEFHFQSCQLGGANTADAGIGGVCPEGIAKAFCSDGGCGDEEAVNGKGGHIEGGIHGAETVNVVDHGEEDGGR